LEKKVFEEIQDITISDSDILSFKADAIVSPANSFGYMDGGLDLKFRASNHSIEEIQKR